MDQSLWDPHNQTDIDRLERVQRQAARFIVGDYHSREPSCHQKPQTKPSLPPCRTDVSNSDSLTSTRWLRAGPAMLIDQVLKPLQANKRQTKPTKLRDFSVEKKKIQRNPSNPNSRPRQVTHSNTKHDRNTFLVRTTASWNKLSDAQVKTPTPEPFRTTDRHLNHHLTLCAHPRPVASILK